METKRRGQGGQKSKEVRGVGSREGKVRRDPEGQASRGRSPMGPRRTGVEREKSDGVWKVERQGDRSLKGRIKRAMREARDKGEVGQVEAEVKRSGGMGK